MRDQTNSNQNIEIITTPSFRQNAKSLSGKYPSLKKELEQLEVQLLENPMQGKSISNQNDRFRVAIRKRGEHDGFSILTRVYFKVHDSGQNVVVYLADIHDRVDLPSGIKK